jgi:hypothetical protein
MSRFDRMFARRSEAKRPVRRSQKLRPVRDPVTGKVDWVRPPRHVQGDQWWKNKAASIAERNLARDRKVK